MTSTINLPAYVLAAREQLAAGRQRIRARHDAGTSGVEVSAALADLVDAIVLDFFDRSWNDLATADRAVLRGQFALAPLGGYGRRDLAPYSDVDLLLLHAPAAKAAVAPLASRLMRDLNDTGLDLGYCVRTPADACSSSLSDATIYTSLVEARFLAGSATFFGDFARAFQHLSQRGWKKLIPLVDEARREERRKHGESGYMLRPNVKRTRGGLRGIQLLRWIGFARYGVVEPVELAHIGALTPDEAQTLERAREYLLRLRNELHFHQRHKQDVLDRNEQVRLAAAFGFPGDAGLLPVEQFMRQFFQITNDVRYIVANFVAASRPHVRMSQVLGPLFSRAVGRDYRVGPVHISATASGLEKLRTDLNETMRLIELASAYDRRIAHDTWVAVRQAVPRLANQVTPEVNRRFLRLLNEPARLGEMLRRLVDVGLVERIIPAFSHARGLLQFNDYHQYTVDEHSLRAVENAAALLHHKGPLADVYRALERKGLLHLALLLHDLGKGYPDDHSEVGRNIAIQTTARLGLSPEECELVTFLVHKHLLMPHVAIWRNLEDPDEIVKFAYEAASPERLQLLYVLSAADIDAVGPGVLTDWKLNLLTELYERAMQQLAGDQPATNADQRIAQQRADVLAAATKLGGHGEWLARQVESTPTSYLFSSPPEKIAAELLRLRSIQIGHAEAWHHWHKDRRVSEYTIGTHEQTAPGVFHRLTGALSSLGLQILTAQINTLADGLILDRFLVQDFDHRDEPPADRTQRVCRALTASLATPDGERPQFRRVWAATTADPHRSVTALPTRVLVDAHSSPKHTLVDVFTHDQAGLLYTIARTLYELGLSVTAAKIGTYMNQVVDVFYVTDTSGRRVDDPQRIEDIKSRLLSAIDELTRENRATRH